ncbi:MAG: acyltransferase domain-containing protein [Chloroflexi bacterium]|nr:acyltransferase domain-containing protein [Chloroflexota bacterium]
MKSIAIIGLAGLFPQALTIAQFWDNIVRKRSCITEVPPSRWRLEDYYDPDPSAPDKTYSRWGGFIPDVEFDPLEFGIPPNVLEVTDVAQLLSLVVAKQALEDAGYGERSGRAFDRERTGVVLGIGGGQKLITPLTSRLQGPIWEEAMRSSGLSTDDAHAISEKIKLAYVPWEENSFPGMLGNVIAGRIANRLDLGGINCVVDAACAGSLAALRVALSELAEGQADMLITGGVDTDNSIFMYMCFSKTPAFTPGDRIRPFDANSDGMMVGEAAIMFVLKRLEDAERDSDRIYAVIRGLGSASDGRFSSIYAPRSEGQARALKRAYANASVTPDSIGLIEAHGTGTVAGDLVEVTTLRKVFGEGHARPNQVALGSVKSQIGHTKSAAGAAGLMKAALALHHRVLPPTINVEQPHPAGDFGNSELYLNTETRPWLRLDSQTPRRAGVSSFGFGGSNFHVVLEEYGSEASDAYRLHSVSRPVILHAASPSDLAGRCAAAAGKLRSANASRAFRELVDESAEPSIPPAAARVGFVADSPEAAARLLDRAAEQIGKAEHAPSWTHPDGIAYRRASLATDGAVVALFPGQGSQYVNMGRDLAVSFPEVRELLAKADALFQADGAPALSSVLFPVPSFGDAAAQEQEEALRRTDYAQPAIGVLSAAMYSLLRDAGFRPSLAAGHSFGELTALWAAGALSEDDFLHLARARGKAMAPPPEAGFDAGAMLSVLAGAAELEPLLAELDGVVMANLNGPRQTVLAGPTTAVVAAESALGARGLKTMRLPVAAAFHSPLVAHGQAGLASALREVTIRPAGLNVFANATGQPYTEALAETLTRQIVEPVRFVDDIEGIYAAGGRVFVEIGPRAVLTNLVKDILGDREHVAIALNPQPNVDSDRQFRFGLVQLVVLGLPLQLGDRHARELPELSRKSSPATVVLTGANYVSPKTRQAYVDALNDGHQVSSLAASAPPPPPVDQALPARSEPAPTQDAQRIAEAYADQAASAALHQQFLADQAEQAKLFLDLVARQQTLAGQALAPSALESVANSLALFQSVQAETVRAHQRYLELQAERFAPAASWYPTTSATLGAVPKPPSTAPLSPTIAPPSTGAAAPIIALPSAPAAAPTVVPLPSTASSAAALPSAAALRPATPVPPGGLPAAMPVVGPTAPAVPTAAAYEGQQSARRGMPDTGQITVDLLTVVSAKTGYPVDTLEVDMEIEADLGIDSIKRVEILAAMRERFPDGPAPKPGELAQLRTLRQIIEYLGQQAPAAITHAAPATEPAPAVEDVSHQLLEIVSQKTGYPPDTLELDMEIEADLGIDSIKRVEILAAMRERFPDTPPLNPGQLAELRTLRHVLDYLFQVAAPRTEPAAAANPSPRIDVVPARLRPLPPPDRLHVDVGGDVCLLVDDGTPLAGALADSLEELGWRVLVLRLPEHVVPARPDRRQRVVELADLADDALASKLAQIQAECGPISTFLYLHAQSPEGPALFARSEREAVRAVFFLAKNLKRSLTGVAAAGAGRAAFMAVARLDGAFGIGLDGDQPLSSSAIAGGLFGLVKTLHLEWPGVHCRAVDLGPSYPLELAVADLVAELLDPNELIAEVALGPHGRVALAPGMAAAV